MAQFVPCKPCSLQGAPDADSSARMRNAVPHDTTIVEDSSPRRPNGAWIAGCFLFFLVLYGFTSRSEAQVSDEAAMFSAGASLATKGSLAIDGLRWLQDIVDIGKTGVAGHLYSMYFPGNTLGAACLYRIGARPDDTPYVWGNPDFGFHELAASASGAHLAFRFNALPGAIGLTFLFLLAWRLYGRGPAIGAVMLIGLGSDWWYESRGFFSEVGAGAGLIAALYFAEARRPYQSSLALGISLLFRPTNLIGLPIWLFSMRGSVRRSLPSVSFLIAGLGILAYYNWLRFGSVGDFGYGSWGFHGPLPVGIVGVLLSPGRSIFWYSPIVILVFTGLRELFARNKGLGVLVTGTAVGYVLIAAAWDVWWGGRVWGSRLLTPIVPLLGVPIAAIVRRFQLTNSTRLGVAIALLGALGAGIQLLTLSQDPVVVVGKYISSGYASFADSIMSLTKNALALQLKNLPGTSLCTLDAYSLRALLSHCK